MEGVAYWKGGTLERGVYWKGAGVHWKGGYIGKGGRIERREDIWRVTTTLIFTSKDPASSTCVCLGVFSKITREKINILNHSRK